MTNSTVCQHQISSQTACTEGMNHSLSVTPNSQNLHTVKENPERCMKIALTYFPLILTRNMKNTEEWQSSRPTLNQSTLTCFLIQKRDLPLVCVRCGSSVSHSESSVAYT